MLNFFPTYDHGIREDHLIDRIFKRVIHHCENFSNDQYYHHLLISSLDTVPLHAKIALEQHKNTGSE